MRLVFLGTPEAAVPALDALLESGHDVATVVTRPDRPAGRSGRAQAPPVKIRAKERGIEVFQPARVRGGPFRSALAAARPELLVVVAYGRILVPQVLALAPRGAINLHFSLLPRYRGAAPVQWALARGERTTGVTTMQINEGLDEGDILLQREVPVEPGEHAPQLERRLASIGAGLLVETLAGLTAGSIEARPQRHADATLAPIIRPADGAADPRWPAAQIAGRIRGFDPWPGVWMLRGGKRIRLLEARVVDRDGSEAAVGTVLPLEEAGLPLVCGEGTLLLLERVQPEGRRAMSVRDAVNGRQLAPGDRLEAIA